jgi:hypothetical protein
LDPRLDIPAQDEIILELFALLHGGQNIPGLGADVMATTLNKLPDAPAK